MQNISLYSKIVLISPFYLALSQGFGCDENYLPDEDRIDCGTPGTEEEECRAKNCTWCPTTPRGTPWCYIPGEPSTGGYVMVGEPEATPNGIKYLFDI